MKDTTATVESRINQLINTSNINADLRERLHCCLETHAPELQQELLEALGLSQGEIRTLRQDCAAKAGLHADFKALRVVRPMHLEYDFPSDAVFALLCPVVEDHWVPGWRENCRMIHTDSGIAEDACIFVTRYPGEGRAVWICTDYDRATGRIEYVKHIEGMAIVKWQMQVKPLTPQRSALFSIYNMTALSEAGNRFVAEFDARPVSLLENLGKMTRHYLAHGQMINPDALQD